jgi:arginase family enzyme
VTRKLDELAKRDPFETDLAQVEIALLGVPFDLGVTNRAGARHGPREIRNASATAVGPMHHVSKLAPFNRAVSPTLATCASPAATASMRRSARSRRSTGSSSEGA